MLIDSINKNRDITNNTMHHNVNRSQLLKLDFQRSYSL